MLRKVVQGLEEVGALPTEGAGVENRNGEVDCGGGWVGRKTS